MDVETQKRRAGMPVTDLVLCHAERPLRLDSTRQRDPSFRSKLVLGDEWCSPITNFLLPDSARQQDLSFRKKLVLGYELYSSITRFLLNDKATARKSQSYNTRHFAGVYD